MNAFIERILNRRRAYRLVLLDGEGKPHRHAEIMLADLRRFCRANTSTAMVNPITRSVDPIAMAMAEGRREVWNRIMSHLHVDDNTIMQMSEE